MLVYRSSRFLNLAHGQLGALPALLLAKLVIDRDVPYWIALPVCVVIGSGTGILVDRYLVRRLRARTSSGVTALLFTVGISQLLLFFMLVPAFRPDNVELGRRGYPLPFHGSFTVDNVVFGGQHIAILLFCPIAVLGLGAFLRWTIFGKMVRAVASNEDAARLCGISPRFVSALTWGIAGALSTFSAVLAAPSAAPGAAGTGSFGSVQLLLALGAAAFGSFVSIPWTVAGGVILGMVNQLALYETSNAGTAQLVVFLLILGVVFARGRRIAAVFTSGGVQVEDRPPLRIPPGARNLLLARRYRPLLIGSGVLLALVAPFVPGLGTEGARFELSVILIFGIVGISMTLLTGWGGQLSLGHLAVVGVGAFVGARQAAEGRSLVLLLVLTALLGAAVLVVVGLPALRVRGLALAVTTLGFAVVSVQWLFHASWFTGSDTGFVNLTGVIPPVNGIEPTDMLGVYWTTLAVLVAVAFVAGRVRRSTFGGR
ncbi:MAG: inner-rane translocator, partial [Acidimicrobiales bacterium]|nr:inner-rane translocator [Acidimicrobiales bacterium]